MTRVDLHWIPLGAGAHVVRWSGAVYEHWRARREHRPTRHIYHSALQIHGPEGRIVIEQAPAARHGERRGVVAVGPVGSRAMFCWPLSRYEVRCWAGGVIDDLDHGVGGPVTVSTDDHAARRVIECAPNLPPLTWGRDAGGAGEMWNSNSVIAWILQRSGIDAPSISPPSDGVAPGWAAGWVRAREQLSG